ncbi:EthD family reductase [Microbacterium sp. Bi121]|uniref:EthD family reductase n=1 Tax=Microbacterium sp. Bi121 TaxID=2822348 RepID=UPI001DB9E01E|nr:EthD family reductase [Microbacterium sp. Bi121]CAH0156710.1 hypothetical protein SRABI121_01400 [Microbacterium sp. Bi121]
MYRVIVVIRRKVGMAREEFLEHWLADHPRFVERLPGVRAYRQSPAIEHRKEWPFDGMAELFFDSLGDIARAFDCVEARELFAHEEDFLEDATWFIADEGRDVPLASLLNRE